MNSKIRPYRTCQIFIIDDDSEDVELMQRAFNRLDHAHIIRHLRNGKEFFEALKTCVEAGSTDLPDLILLDLNMPVLDGRETLSKLKNDKRFSQIPTVVFSSSHAAEDVESTYALGANSFISKPTTFSGFLDIAQSIETYWLKLACLPHTR